MKKCSTFEVKGSNKEEGLGKLRGRLVVVVDLELKLGDTMDRSRRKPRYWCDSKSCCDKRWV